MTIRSDLEYRFGESFADCDVPNLLATMAGRGSCRVFRETRLPADRIRMLCAIALSTPTKSDLQQRDIVLVDDPEKRKVICGLVGNQAWIANAPHIAVFCGNNRRQRLLHDWRGHPFANDHFDAVFNAAVDAGIALAGFVTAAEATGLGCCPISAVRNHASEVSDLLDLPDHVFPVAGLAFGLPAVPHPEISPRLPLDVTLHQNSYSEDGLKERVISYDASRQAVQPYGTQRMASVYGQVEDYGWSEDKTRQYSRPERANFGEFLRQKKFNFD